MGIILDEHLSWQLHVNHIKRKLSKFIPLIYNVGDSLDKRSLKLLYNSLIHPILVYGNVVWGGCCKFYLRQLGVMQRKIIRLVSFRNKFDHMAAIFLDFNNLILTAESLNNYMCVLYVYKSLQGDDVFTRYVPERYQTRLAFNDALVVPDTRSLHSRQSVRW